MFTGEYLLRFAAAPSDKQYGSVRNPWLSRLYYVASFYSLVDLVAIVPYFLAKARPAPKPRILVCASFRS